MRCGLFGKLPSKRDFISYNVPRPFLTLWENWLQSAVAASRTQLGHAWQNAFLTAPIWRFWIGSSLCGSSATGAIMPSVDRVGRYFPLTICACSSEGFYIPPPTVDPQETWYKASEDALLCALDEGFDSEPASLVEKLELPRMCQQPDQAFLAQAPVWTLPSEYIEKAFGALLAKDELDRYHAKTYWWTHGGTNRMAQIAMFTGLPDPYAFSGFLTGAFAGAQA